jgi:hypothetical protein
LEERNNDKFTTLEDFQEWRDIEGERLQTIIVQIRKAASTMSTMCRSVLFWSPSTFMVVVVKMMTMVEVELVVMVVMMMVVVEVELMMIVVVVATALVDL